MTQASDRIEAEAARWLIQVESAGSPGQWAALDAWLSANPRHRAAFLRLSAAWRRAEGLRSLRAFDGSVDVDLLSRRGLRARQAAESRRTWRPAWSFGLSAVAAVIVAVYLATPLIIERLGTSVYATEIGMQRHIALVDGSTVDLNTNTELQVRFSKGRRQITLVRGEAAFNVVHDPSRPFDVHAGRSLVRVLGTAFSVRLHDAARIDVRVIEGRVAISPPPTAVLNAGESAMVNRGQVVIQREPVDILRRRLLWRQGRLFFNGETLAEAVAEFNRYNRSTLVIADPRLAGQRISGTFDAIDPEGFVTTVRALPAVSGAGATAIRLEGQGP